MIPVLYVLQSLDVGGTQRQLLFLLRGLDRRRFRAIVACDRAGELAPAVQALGATVVVLRGGRYRLRDPRGWLLRWWELWRLARRHRARIVHAQWALYALFGIPAGWAAGAPVRLVSNHGHWLRRADRLVYALIGRLLTAIVEGTPGCIDRLAAQGLPRAKLRLVDYGVDGAPYEDPGLRARGRRALGVPPEAFVVARVSRVYPDKGVGDVVEAAALVVPKAPEAWFLVVGDGDELGHLRERARELGVAERVRFTGFYTNLPEVLGAADVLTMTSRMDELGLATLEALAAGCPVVAIQHGPIIAEAVEHEVNGILLPEGDVRALAEALLALHADPERRARLGAAARRRWAERYGLEVFGRKMGALYTTLLGGTDQ
jgi:glycosyltransferase involved in cell wall biosynthesis